MQLEQQYIDHFNRGTKYLNKGNYDKALSFFRKAEKGAKVKEVYLNLGNSLSQLDKTPEAQKYFQLALEESIPYANGKFGQYPLAMNNLGLLRFRTGDCDGAIHWYKKSIEIDGSNGDPIWNYANALLKKCCTLETDDWKTAWQLYSYRFNRTSPTPIDGRFKWWDGTSKVPTLVVLSEQGQGDKIQFGRYLELLKPYCDRLVIQIPKVLNTLFHNYETTESLDHLEHSTTWGVPFCSLAGILGWDSASHDWIDTAPFKPRTYNTTGPNILVEWSGSLSHANNRHRNTIADWFLPLSEYGNLYSFRPRAPRGITPLNTISEDSWVDTVEAVLGADLIVTVDTSIVHLCGTLNKPTIMLQPRQETDWRWGMDNMGYKNIWYPTVYIARNPYSWDVTMKRVKTKIEELLAQNKPT